jgi:uncharacterized paraquat-inducible protein A
MTKRAELAAAELARRGWDVGESPGLTHCHNCKCEVHARDNYCAVCGEKLPAVFGQSSLDDIEAAIVAAVGAGS